MNKDEFSMELQKIHERVLSKSLSEEEANNYTESLFESIKHFDDNEEEFWYARELQTALEYGQWRRFNEVIEKAKISCENSQVSVLEHFANVGKSSPMPNGGNSHI